MHPFMPDVSGLSDTELDNKILDLTRKYFQTVRLSPSISNQIVLLLESYKAEQQNRFSIKLEKSRNNGDSDINDLIRID
jgi:hypothetical protein